MLEHPPRTVLTACDASGKRLPPAVNARLPQPRRMGEGEQNRFHEKGSEQEADVAKYVLVTIATVVVTRHPTHTLFRQ
jgi:hypothetical protein